MEFIAHRINTLAELKNLPHKYGVEVDLRDTPEGTVHMAHDPFVKGEDFETYLRSYKHGTMILNVKSERIEFHTLELLKKYDIQNYFFLDSSFPMIHSLSSKGEDRIALRYSEFEGLDTLANMKNRIKWVWVDCFSKLPLTKKKYDYLKKLGFKLCLVSPELQGRDADIEPYKVILKNERIIFDAICTKSYNIRRWQ